MPQKCAVDSAVILTGGGIFALTYDPEPIKEGAITVLVE